MSTCEHGLVRGAEEQVRAQSLGLARMRGRGSKKGGRMAEEEFSPLGKHAKAVFPGF